MKIDIADEDLIYFEHFLLDSLSLSAQFAASDVTGKIESVVEAVLAQMPRQIPDDAFPERRVNAPTPKM